MSHWGDHIGEMPNQRLLDDTSIEAILHGRNVPSELEALASAVCVLRETARQPVQPSPELTAFMAAGGYDPYRDRRPSRWQAASAKLAGTSLRLKIAAGFAAGLTGVTGMAAAAGELPETMQASVETAVAFVTPMDFTALPAPAKVAVEQPQVIDGQKHSGRARADGQPKAAVALQAVPTPTPTPTTHADADADAEPTPTPTPTRHRNRRRLRRRRRHRNRHPRRNRHSRRRPLNRIPGPISGRR